MKEIRVKYLILGAGPAGLAFAATLSKLSETSFVILEKNCEAGGLCRSAECDGAALDIGGGHFLDVRKKNVLDFIFSFMPQEEWKFYKRNTKIVVGKHTIGYPFEASIWQLPFEEQVGYLESIAKASFLRREEKPERFMDWIRWKLGDKIAENYMIPYNQKIWSCDLNELGTYWLEKLPDVSFSETLASCLKRAPYGSIPAHAEFYYPQKAGYGEVFLRIAESLKEHIRYDCRVNKLDCDDNTINDAFTGEYVINTIPWHEFASSAGLNELTDHLKYTSVDIDYYSQDSDIDAHWTYYADPVLTYHRKVHRDHIIEGAKGFWTETNSTRRKEIGDAHFENQYAYPLNTLEKPKIIGALLEKMKKRNVYGLGRWGEWEHLNSDVVIEHGMTLAHELVEWRAQKSTV